ncbi:MAG: hypothetical protein ABIL58_03120 [Pseudomonadota bacterium]
MARIKVAPGKGRQMAAAENTETAFSFQYPGAQGGFGNRVIRQKGDGPHVFFFQVSDTHFWKFRGWGRGEECGYPFPHDIEGLYMDANRIERAQNDPGPGIVFIFQRYKSQIPADFLCAVSGKAAIHFDTGTVSWSWKMVYTPVGTELNRHR